MKKFNSLLLAGLLASGPLYAQNIAKVNGVVIPSARADAMYNQLMANGQGAKIPNLKDRIKEQLITYELVTQEASKNGLTKQPDIAMQLEFARQNVLFTAFLQDYIKKNPVSDAEMQSEYDKLKAGATSRPKEYHARHILVKTEAEAKTVITKLKGGAKFEDMAKQYSQDPGNKDKGGDLDWASPENFVPEFGKAMAALNKGQTTDAPVQTQFGWHVIHVDDTRESPFPPLDAVKPQLQDALQRQKLDKMMADLRAKATIE